MHRSGFRIGRVAGIDLYVDWSWLFIFLLVTWNLAAGVFPQLHPDWSTGLDIGLAVLAALLFFASVLAHELAHSLVATARGLPVRSITLFLFGGVSNIQREPQTPGTEFWMAIVGPITSIVLGIIFLALGGVSAFPLSGSLSSPGGVLARLSPLATMLLWLGPINIVVGIFNLIPGFPLDGGRVLRSVLWAASGNLRQATRWAAWIGQAIGWLFIIAGIAMIFGVSFPFFGTGLISGLWLAFIGWFLNNAAVQSYQQVMVEDLLEGVPVSRLMHTNVPGVPETATVGDVINNYLMNSDERSFPVMREGEQLAGLVCLEDLRKVERARWDTTTVEQVMTPIDRLAVVRPDQDATEALNLLTTRDVRQLPVVVGGRLVGMLRRRDFVRWMQLRSQFAAR